MIGWSDRKPVDFDVKYDVFTTPKKRQYPTRNLHYVESNSLIKSRDQPIYSEYSPPKTVLNQRVIPLKPNQLAD